MLLQRIGNRGIRLGTLFDRAAARSPANLVVLDHDLDVADVGRRVTMTEVAELVAELASRLAAADVSVGDRVAIYETHKFDISLLAAAAARLGAVPVMLSPQLDGETVGALLRRAERPFLLTDQAKIEKDLSAAVLAEARHVLLAAGEYPGATRLADLAGASRVEPLAMPPDHPTMITHTSGTTGTPKLAVHTGRTFEARYRPQGTVARLVGRGEPFAIHVSFVHSRMYTAMPIAILQGHPVLILADDDPDSVADLFAQAPPGLIEAHPNTFLRWEPLADDPRAPLANVKYFSSTFDAIHPRTVNRLLAASKRRRPRFIQMYGQSEVGPIAGRAYTPKWGADADGRCVGMPFPGMTGVRGVSRNGEAPSPTTPGYIEVRSNGRIVTYLGEHERYQKQEDGEWWRMGDVGYVTKWGCLHLLDREVDLVPGVDSTLAVEDRLFTRLDDLVEEVIVGMPDGHPQPVVCTSDDKPLDRQAWAAAVADLPPMAAPVQWSLAGLPRAATTKIKRLRLAELLATGAGKPR